MKRQINVIKDCPVCGAPLHERISAATGTAALRCLRWPCTHTEPIPESVVLRRAGQPELPLFPRRRR